MTASLDHLLNKQGGPYIHLLQISSSALAGWLKELEEAASVQRPRAIIRLLDGMRCQTAAGFFAEIARGLEFPHYFGHNWAALSDCLIDLGWLPASIYLVAVCNAEEMFSVAGGRAWRALGELLNEEAADAAVPLRLILATGAAGYAGESTGGSGDGV